ncbi:MAG: hypothetical protein JNM17_29855 [Archangium sp.]|nr:hypothetical protein [Archangium sp.]
MKTLALLGVVFVAACGPVDLVVVNVPDGGEFQQPDDQCTKNEDCLGGQFCSKPNEQCAAPLGVCRQRPISCTGEHMPECGCDGVTYFNRCLRENAGVSMREPGPCRNARRCDTVSACDSGQYCFRIAFMPQECGMNVSGACWVLPDTQCIGGPTFVPCGGGMCVGVCDAVRRQQPMLIRQQGSGPCP